MTITKEHFTKRVGHPPVQDDLERVNCPLAGESGHYFCGWDHEADLPVFMTGRRCEMEDVTTQENSHSLIDRLRTMGNSGWNPIGNEAADEIIRLRAEVRGLERLLEQRENNS